MPTCNYSDLPVEACGHCRNAGKRRRLTVTARITRRIEARYPGQCHGCGVLYAAGARITPGETGGWIAERGVGEDGDA